MGAFGEDGFAAFFADALVQAFNATGAVAHLKGIVRRQVCIAVGERVVLGEIERPVGFQFVETGHAPIGQLRCFSPSQGAGNRFEKARLAVCEIEFQQDLHHAKTLAAGDGRRFKSARPSRLHRQIVLLRPSWLRIGHLG